MMKQIQKIKNNFESIKDLDIDIQNLIININKLHNKCMEKNNIHKNIINLYWARTYLESSITILKSMINSNENELIGIIENKNININLNIDSCFDNMMANLDVDFDKLRTYVDDSNVKIRNAFVVNMAVKSLRERLVNYMYDLILFPLINSQDIYKSTPVPKTNKLKIDGKEIEVNNRKVFEYILFKEVYESSKLKGSPNRQKVKTSSGTMNSTFTETNIIKPGRPKNTSLQQMEQINEPIKDIEEEFPEIYEYNN